MDRIRLTPEMITAQAYKILSCNMHFGQHMPTKTIKKPWWQFWGTERIVPDYDAAWTAIGTLGNVERSTIKIRRPASDTETAHG